MFQFLSFVARHGYGNVMLVLYSCLLRATVALLLGYGTKLNNCSTNLLFSTRTDKERKHEAMINSEYCCIVHISCCAAGRLDAEFNLTLFL
jgi:hypothetical protein